MVSYLESSFASAQHTTHQFHTHTHTYTSSALRLQERRSTVQPLQTPTSRPSGIFAPAYLVEFMYIKLEPNQMNFSL